MSSRPTCPRLRSNSPPPSRSIIATSWAIVYLGGTPVYPDIDEATMISVFPELTNEQVDHLAATIRSFMDW